MTHEQVEGVKIQNDAISNLHVQNLNANLNGNGELTIHEQFILKKNITTSD